MMVGTCGLTGVVVSYYRLLGLEKEPFSTSPDPSLFYQAKDHKAALYRLLIALRLKRGLSLVLGDVGTGKTTLSRRLFQIVSPDTNFYFHIILNPIFQSEKAFLAKLAELFCPAILRDGLSTADYLDGIEKRLLEISLKEKKTTVILIDEAQKLDRPLLEILRTLLNFETNEYKLVQFILMSQLDLLPKITGLKNFWDRIALKYMLNPLGLAEMTEMIQFRLEQAGYKAKAPLFTGEAYEMIYAQTEGYPRRTTALCHNLLERIVMDNKTLVNHEIVQKVVSEEHGILEVAHRVALPEEWKEHQS
ncbi:MAG: AAA family ATPase [Deltaproteobacteria bacterium]|nr:AAA family ATPase [Deltaproteobacteria bacterium]